MGMTNQLLSLRELADFLQNELATDRYLNREQGGIYHHSDRPISRLGLALEPWPALPKWLEENKLDALWLHRPWQLDRTKLPPDVGIVYHHLPFDEALTMGYNTLLANLMNSLGTPEPLGYKQDTTDTGELLPKRAIGMLFDRVEQEFDAVLREVSTMFGGYDRAEAGRCQTGQHTIGRIAVVGAMNDALVREAHERGASLYLTGQYRKPAQKAVDDTGMAVIAVGHYRSEEWGMRALAALLHERWPTLNVVLPDNSEPVALPTTKNFV